MWFVRWTRKFSNSTVFIGPIVQVLLVAFGTCSPLIINALLDWRYTDSLLNVSNPFYVFDRPFSINNNAWAEILILVPVALVVLLANLKPVIAEVRYTFVARPARVIEEEASLAEVIEVPTGPKSPWDEDT
ncbi:MAG: hypothetical protein SGJ20_06930 [Planctomycetota bacterium]|nr:hypothetical protein [Planctomycetota bacterium]